MEKKGQEKRKNRKYNLIKEGTPGEENEDRRERAGEEEEWEVNFKQQ
jgi:hypothetical protein